MTVFFNRTTQIIVDFAILSLALWTAFFIRFDGPPPFLMFKRLMFVWPWVVGLQYTGLMVFGAHRFAWRFVGLREISRIFAALGAAATLLLTVRIMAVPLSSYSGYFVYTLIPIGVIVVDGTLAALGIGGIRALRRMTTESMQIRERARQADPQNPTILIGAGQAGLLIAKELQARPELGMRAVAFVDDDPLKQGILVHGIPVKGTTSDIAKIVAEYDIQQALISIASARGTDVRRIGRECREIGLPTKIIPTVHDIVSEQVSIGQIRELAIEDLLRRDPVQLEEDAVSEFISDQVIVVTGAGGSIGSELSRQICRFAPALLVMIERAEPALFEAHRELEKQYPEVRIVPCIGDICDGERIHEIFAKHCPNTVFHAAAHKHVPMMESNPGEAVKNNVFGTKTLADVCAVTGVEAFVMVSTDKAVNPSSVMGATKRIAEMYVKSLASKSKTRFVTVRFGNVLGSAGSVIPIFKKQIEEGGPVTVTHPEMTRYFMTIPEACQLILQAGTMGEGGEIFILDMGEPVKIVDLAHDLISLSGFTPGEDMEISFTGVRPGEKLFEELSSSTENAGKTRHPKIFVGQQEAYEDLSLARGLEQLRSHPDDIRDRIGILVAGFSQSQLDTQPGPAVAAGTRRN